MVSKLITLWYKSSCKCLLFFILKMTCGDFLKWLHHFTLCSRYKSSNCFTCLPPHDTSSSKHFSHESSFIFIFFISGSAVVWLAQEFCTTEPVSFCVTPLCVRTSLAIPFPSHLWWVIRLHIKVLFQRPVLGHLEALWVLHSLTLSS